MAGAGAADVSAKALIRCFHPSEMMSRNGLVSLGRNQQKGLFLRAVSSVYEAAAQVPKRRRAAART